MFPYEVPWAIKIRTKIIILHNSTTGILCKITNSNHFSESAKYYIFSEYYTFTCKEIVMLYESWPNFNRFNIIWFKL